MFQVEPRVPVRLLLDLSGSMTAHGARNSITRGKLAAALCYVGLVRLDSIAIHVFPTAWRGAFLDRRATASRA